MLFNKRGVFLVFSACILSCMHLTGQSTTPKTKKFYNQAWKLLDTKPDSSIYYSELAFLEASKNQNLWIMSKSLSYKGYALERLGDPNQALINYFKGLQLAIKADTSDFFNAFTLTRNIAAIQKKHLNFEEAIIYYDSAIYFIKEHIEAYPSVAKKYRDHILKYETLYFRGGTEMASGQLEAANKTFTHLIDATNTPISFKLKSLIHLGLIARDLSDFKTANGFFNEVISTAESDTIAKWRGQHGLALMLFQQGLFDEAVNEYYKAVKIVEPMSNNGEYLFTSYMDLGESYLKSKDYLQAHQALTKALNSWSSERINREPRFYNIYQLLSRSSLYESSHETEKWILKFEEVTKSFTNKQEKLKNEHAKVALNISLESYLSELKHEEEVDSLEREYSLWLIFGILAAIVCCVLSVIYFLKQRTKKRESKINQALRPRSRRFT